MLCLDKTFMTNILSRHNTSSVVSVSAEPSHFTVCTIRSYTIFQERSGHGYSQPNDWPSLPSVLSSLFSLKSPSLHILLSLFPAPHNASWPWRILLSRAAINQPVTFYFSNVSPLGPVGSSGSVTWVKVLISHEWTIQPIHFKIHIKNDMNKIWNNNNNNKQYDMQLN